MGSVVPQLIFMGMPILKSFRKEIGDFLCAFMRFPIKPCDTGPGFAVKPDASI